MIKNPSANAGDMRHPLGPGVGRIPGEGLGNLLQYSCLENPCGQATEEPDRQQAVGSQRAGHD